MGYGCPQSDCNKCKCRADFKPASRPAPFLTIQIKPEVSADIVKNLSRIKDRTDDSDVISKGSTYTFVDKRNGLPLAELDTHAGTLALYKSPKDMAARIDSSFISEKTINNFIMESRALTPVIYGGNSPPQGVQLASTK